MRQNNYQRTDGIPPKGRRSTAANDESINKIGQRGKSNNNAQGIEPMAGPTVRHCWQGRRRYHRQSSASALGHFSGVERMNCSGRSRMIGSNKGCECSKIPERQASEDIKTQVLRLVFVHTRFHFKVEQNHMRDDVSPADARIRNSAARD